MPAYNSILTCKRHTVALYIKYVAPKELTSAVVWSGSRGFAVKKSDISFNNDVQLGNETPSQTLSSSSIILLDTLNLKTLQPIVMGFHLTLCMLKVTPKSLAALSKFAMSVFRNCHFQAFQ